MQMLIGAVVTTIREHVADGGFDDDEIPEIVAFHDATEDFWRATVATNPPMTPGAMTKGIRELLAHCKGALASFQIQLERALAQAERFEEMKRHREAETSDGDPKTRS